MDKRNKAVTDSAAPPLRTWVEHSIAHIQFDRPEVLNAINVPMAKAFHAACKRISDDTSVRAVVISGKGRAFLAGGDVVAMVDTPVTTSQELIRYMHGGIEILSSLGCPVIASLQGSVAGGGLGVALACDIAIAEENTRFSVAYLKIGACADCSTSWGLPRVVGLRNALRIALLGDTVSAEEALNLGLISRVVKAGELATETQKIAEKLAREAPLAVASLKRLFRQSFDHNLHDQLTAESEAFLTCAATEDFKEGISAFLEKRAPNYQGR
ncbi:enoyl-CoA hydratase/isomerase family protein [Herbaspirillum robiniae]|uniref:enoyl-CoA hydratase/isomerase family protein n=1 Tax=Herbaspirillum robiniae TaxID=2014887 RepID=UPI003D76DE3A